jgi:hypothetical protein
MPGNTAHREGGRGGARPKAGSSAERVRRHRLKKKLSAEAGTMLFTRPDWSLFLDPARLPQKAGCDTQQVRAVALKELADNALDAGPNATLERVDADTWIVANDGPGLDAATIPTLFAVDRPLTSSKLLRRPTRGAVGNGLRVVTGAAVASGGSLEVEIRGRRFRIEVDRQTGETKATELTCNAPRRSVTKVTDPGTDAGCNAPRRSGTKVTIAFGPALPSAGDDGHLARDALRFPGPACEPFRSHLPWYDTAAWAELAAAAPPGTTAAQLLAHMGIESDDDRPAAELSYVGAWSRQGDRDVPEPRLLLRGDGGLEGYAHTKQDAGDALVEAWAKALERVPPSRARSTVKVFVNRTRVVLPGTVTSGGYLQLGGNYFCSLDRVKLDCSYTIELSVTAPHVPIVNDGKTPDLRRWSHEIRLALESVLRAAYRKLAPPKRHGDIKEAAFEVMEEAYLEASADNTLPATATQVMYQARRMIAEILGPDRDLVDRKYFTQTLLPDFVALHEGLCADWDVIYDARGALVEPHTGKRVPLGTEAVREYLQPRHVSREPLLSVSSGLRWQAKPRDRYRTAVYVEKQGFEPLIEAARLQERYDCAILSTKGMVNVSCRHLLDRLGRDATVVLIAHDFDRTGMAIAHNVGADGRRYTFEHTPRFIDIGLRLAEAREMGLQDEPAPDEGPGPDKLREYGATADEIEFLCGRKRRVELNAMTSDQFVAWLESKLREHGAGKVVPDAAMLEAKARETIAARIIRERAAEVEVAAWAAAGSVQLPPDLIRRVRAVLATYPSLSWEEAVERVMAPTIERGAA